MKTFEKKSGEKLIIYADELYKEYIKQFSLLKIETVDI